MGIAITHPTRKHHHAVIENGAIPFAERLQAVQEVGILLDMPDVNPLVLSQLFFVVFMMTKLMMATTDTRKKAEIAPRNFIGEHKRGNPCGIRPETQGHDVKHQANLFCVIDATLLASDGIPIGDATAKGVNFGL